MSVYINIEQDKAEEDEIRARARAAASEASRERLTTLRAESAASLARCCRSLGHGCRRGPFCLLLPFAILRGIILGLAIVLAQCYAAPDGSGPPPVGAKVKHAGHGKLGTVITHEASGGVQVRYDDGSVCEYGPSALGELQPFDFRGACTVIAKGCSSGCSWAALCARFVACCTAFAKCFAGLGRCCCSVLILPFAILRGIILGLAIGLSLIHI